MLSLDFFRLSSTVHMPRSKNSSGVYRPKCKKKNALLACLVQRLSAFTSRCRTDKGGRGALEPLPERGGRTKRFGREFQSRESHTEAETKKTPDRITEERRIIYNLISKPARVINTSTPWISPRYRFRAVHAAAAIPTTPAPNAPSFPTTRTIA